MATASTLSRRAFLTGGRTATTAHVPPPSIAPPGVRSDWIEACTGCGACVDACPTGIIRLVGQTPGLDFSNGECVFCGGCAEACPEPVFEDTTPLRFPHTVEIADTCLVQAGIACMTCRDACPSEAITLRPRMGGPFLPEIDAETCTGCGACIAPCPVDAISVSPEPREPSDA